jgi:hypothetical protein
MFSSPEKLAPQSLITHFTLFIFFTFWNILNHAFHALSTQQKHGKTPDATKVVYFLKTQKNSRSKNKSEIFFYNFFGKCVWCIYIYITTLLT